MNEIVPSHMSCMKSFHFTIPRFFFESLSLNVKKTAQILVYLAAVGENGKRQTINKIDILILTPLYRAI
jgi:hypothetical protein